MLFRSAVGLTAFPILGSMPNIEDSVKTPFKPKKPCERQEQPNLEAGIGPAPQTGSAPAMDPAAMLAGLPPEEIREAAMGLGLPEEAAEALAEAGSDE